MPSPTPVRATGGSVHRNANCTYDPSRLGARGPLPARRSSRSCRRPTPRCNQLRCVLSGVAWSPSHCADCRGAVQSQSRKIAARRGDRKSTRLNSSHGYISYAVFCLKKKKIPTPNTYIAALNDAYGHPIIVQPFSIIITRDVTLVIEINAAELAVTVDRLVRFP